MPITFAEQLRLMIKGPAGGRFPSSDLPKQHVEEAPGPFHLTPEPMHASSLCRVTPGGAAPPGTVLPALTLAARPTLPA